MINRHQFAEEIKLRGLIREALDIRMNARTKEETKFRNLVRFLVKEAETTDEAPSQYTGINVLSDTLKKIIPQLEDVYKQLTTSPEQRTSFRAHIINAVQNALAPEQATEKEEGGESPEDEEGFIALDEQDLEIQLASDPSFIDIAPEPIEEPEPEGPVSPIEGEDATGRNFASDAFTKVEKTILDSYNMLSNEEDQKLFYDYLITNLKLYFDKSEDELQPTLPEPTTDEYEAESEKDDAEDEDGALGGEDDMVGEEESGVEELVDGLQSTWSRSK